MLSAECRLLTAELSAECRLLSAELSAECAHFISTFSSELLRFSIENSALSTFLHSPAMSHFLFISLISLASFALTLEKYSSALAWSNLT